jgi:hypothetical protein
MAEQVAGMNTVDRIPVGFQRLGNLGLLSKGVVKPANHPFCRPFQPNGVNRQEPWRPPLGSLSLALPWLAAHLNS